MFISNKRFIAGAVCPRCGILDVVVVWNDDTSVFRGCVNCDYQELMEDSETEVSNVNLITRVSSGFDEKIVLDDEEKPLRILSKVNEESTDSAGLDLAESGKDTSNS